MKSDVLIVGSELEGLLAALRLTESGYRVRLIAPGAGSLHYASGAIHVLGYHPATGEPLVTNPLEALHALHEGHPYRKIGQARIEGALKWFLDVALAESTTGYRKNGSNRLAVTPAGLGMPVWACTKNQATFEDIEGKSVAVVSFEGHLDLPAGLLAQGLRQRNIECALCQVEAPDGRSGSLGIARAFDDLDHPDVYFEKLAPQLPENCQVVLFPAVLGLARYHDVVAVAELTLERRCLEVPTLPPSVPGVRLYQQLLKQLRDRGVMLHLGTELRGSEQQDQQLTALFDTEKRRYEGGAFIVANGGVLMGGLEVLSCGRVQEPLFDLAVHQTQPLSRGRADLALDALQETGVKFDEQLRPLALSGPQIKNLFVTGATLANWHPTREASAEGVALATGWVAAEEAVRVLGA